MITKPNRKINDLTGESRKLILTLIRSFSKNTGSYLGLEATEEAMIELIDNGFLKICSDENDNFWLEIYDIEANIYKSI